MKPSGLCNIETPVLDSRREVETRKEFIDDTTRQKNALVEKARDTVTEIDGMYGLGDGSIDSTAIVVLERRKDERLGEYAIVARISIEEQEEEGAASEAARQKGKVRIDFGAAFDHEPVLEAEGEEELGEGINGETWYGQWLTNETTHPVDGLLGQLAAAEWSGKDRAETAKNLHTQSMVKIGMITESLTMILDAAKDKALNPQPEQTPA